MSTPVKHPIKYRPEIDGLRAVAVLPVIFFHAGFESFSGGFVGVDIFFVISGFLITSIITKELDQNNFSVINFYERRARRILPALFLVCAVCIPLSWHFLMPAELDRFGQSLVATFLFSSNIYFWLKSDYFAPAADEAPLLHTWSLAVEEQYYAFFPLLLLLIWKSGKRNSFITIALLSAASLILCEILSRIYPSATFYMIPTRAWELFTGSLLALTPYKKSIENKSTSLQSLLQAFGLGLILYSIIVYDKSTRFPSLWTLAPVLGTALIIRFSPSKSIITRLLASKLFVGIGLISYSAYLWHQPLLAFGKANSLETPDPWAMAFLSAASLLLAYISWRYIEAPFRNRRLGRHTVFLCSSIGISFFLAIGLLFYYKSGLPERFNFPTGLTESFDRSPAQCFGVAESHKKKDWLCQVTEQDFLRGDNTSKESFLVLGDSHMYSLLPALRDLVAAEDLQASYVGYSGCTPFLGIYALRKDQQTHDCHQLNSRSLDYVKAKKIKNVLLIARWSYYINGGYEGNDFSYIGLSADSEINKSTSKEAFKIGLRRTIDAYTEAGARVFLIGQIPQQKYDARAIYQEAEILPGSLTENLKNLSVKLAEHRWLQSEINEMLSNEAARQPENVIFIDLTDTFCNTHYCPVGTSKKSFYFDNDHLSITGSRKTVGALKTKFVSRLNR